MLPLKQYIQDGSFDNNTQKFVTAYVPLDIPLEEIKEYTKYKLSIRYLDLLINRISLITGTNMLIGPNVQIKQKRKALVKNIVDLIIKHNSINLHKNQSDNERLDFYSKKFNIDKDLDSVYFFELDDSIFNFVPTASSTDTDINRLKYNNVLLYFMLIFITELNGSQILMMSSDKIANIYVFLKYGPKLFGNLLIKKNINDVETIPITKYPVLCYLIFLVAYFLIKYKLWYYSAKNTKSFNPMYQKIIINSFIDLFNSISMEAGKLPNDYIYLLSTSKLYSQLNSTFKNNDIINLLKKNHIKYSDKPTKNVFISETKEELLKSYSIENPINIFLKPRKIPNFKIGDGINYDKKNDLMYPITKTSTDISNCPQGSYHNWKSVDKEIKCTICNELGHNDIGKINRSDETYYYDLNKIANRRCIEGTLHDFVEQNGKVICSKCKREMNIMYPKEELDKLVENLRKTDDENIQKILNKISKYEQNKEIKQASVDKKFKELIDTSGLTNNNTNYGQINTSVDKLINLLESLIGTDTNLDINKYPVYLRNDTYIIEYAYDGSQLPEPIISTQKDNKINFKENHQFFKTDVYYYTDNKTQIDVFYHAVTLKLLGYKEKHKNYIEINKSNIYLKINPSIKNRLTIIAYDTKYIDIRDMFAKNNKFIKDNNQNYFQILDSLIQDHILKTKLTIDKISSILYKIKFYKPVADNEAIPIFLQTSQVIDKLITKYAKMIKNFQLGDGDRAFYDWNDLRNSFIYEPINWTETNVRPTNTTNINSELINYYDTESNLMNFYLVDELLSIIDSNSEKITKINISQLYIEIIVFIYNINNTDSYKNSLELRRFEYILDGSDVMEDTLKQGKGLTRSKELENNLDDTRADIMDIAELTEEQQEELEDLKEEAEALDVEGDYYQEEDEDYAQEGDYES